MEDKTIIDGTDVSKCKHYTGKVKYLCKDWTCRGGEVIGTKCEENPNCYFKQNARTKQENEKLKDILKYASEYSYIMRVYILDVKRTIPDELKKQDRINNICYGLGGETGEILDYLKKVFYHKQVFKPEILSEEIGDLFWYVCALMYEYDLDFMQILRQNIEKRKKRYPNGFNPLDSLLRKDKDNE